MVEEYGFDKGKYCTRGVQALIDIRVQMKMWDIVMENKKVIKLDYLQIFRLKIQDGKQLIEMEQEVPPFKRTLLIEDPDIIPIGEKVYIIDDIKYSTMMLASEY